MAGTIACFADDQQLIAAAQSASARFGQSFTIFPARDLSAMVRQQVQQAAPDLVLFELSPSLSNLHVFLFLRSDESTRAKPILLVSQDLMITHQAAALGADGALRLPATPEQLAQAVAHLLPEQLALAVGSLRPLRQIRLG